MNERTIAYRPQLGALRGPDGTGKEFSRRCALEAVYLQGLHSLPAALASLRIR
jgi:hypothetical protein